MINLIQKSTLELVEGISVLSKEMKKILNTAKDFKIADYMDENLSMSLGSGSVNLINLTRFY